LNKLKIKDFDIIDEEFSSTNEEILEKEITNKDEIQYNSIHSQQYMQEIERLSSEIDE